MPVEDIGARRRKLERQLEYPTSKVSVQSYHIKSNERTVWAIALGAGRCWRRIAHQ